MTSDRSILADSHLALDVLEYLYDRANVRHGFVNLIDLREHLIAAKWGSIRALREGPGGRYTAYFDGVLALLEELGCVTRKGWTYRYVRGLATTDYAPIVSETEPFTEEPT